MKKTILWSTAILSCLTLSGCSTSQEKQSEEQSKVEQSESEKKDYLSEAKKNIEEEALYQAKDNLEKAKSESEHKEEAEAGIEQIENYQKAESALSDEKYEEAKKYLEKVESSKEGLAEMKDYASNLESSVSEKEKESKEEDEKSSSEENEDHSEKEDTKESKSSEHKESKVGSHKSSSSSSSVSGKNLSVSDKEAINDAMVSWCESQAAKGGMSILEGTFFPHGGWSTEETKVEANTPDGSILLFDGAGVSDDTSWTPTSGQINAIGGAMFYFEGDEDNGQVIGPNYPSTEYYAKSGTQIDYYLWADNGKVYELKVKASGKGEGCGTYNVDISDGSMNQNGAPSYQLSEDQAAISEYQRLLKEHGGSNSNHQETTKETHRSSDGKWNSDKADELAGFMSDWETEMGQEYTQAEVNSSNDTVIMKSRLSLADDSDYEPVQGVAIFKVNGSEVPVSVSDDGSGDGYQIIDAYSGTVGSGKEGGYSYLFTLHNGKPEVLFCDTSKDISTSGNKAYVNFKPTSNQALQKGFADIVNN